MGRARGSLARVARASSTTACAAVLGIALASCSAVASAPATDDACFELVRADGATDPIDGRAFVFLSTVEPEPRRSNNVARLEPVVALDFEGLEPGGTLRIGPANAAAFPAPPPDLTRGDYWVQAVLDTHPRAPWPGVAAGNVVSRPVRVRLGGGEAPLVRLVCDRVLPRRPAPESRFVRAVAIESPRLSAFHGRSVELRALVHLPQAWFDEPERRFPVLFRLAGFGASLDSFEAVDWPAPPLAGEPFVVVYPDPSCELGHSGFANSDNNGPWGDAFVRELLPEVEDRFRGIGDREARVLTGHSSGAWGALSLVVRHAGTFGAVWASSPDPVDFRDFMGVDLYAADANLLFDANGRPRAFCKLGDWTVNYTYEHAQREAVLRGGVLAYFEALLGGRGADGRPEPLFDRETGAVDSDVAARWSRHDLSRILRERWDELGPALDGRIVITVGDRDNFLLQGSVDRLEGELRALGADVRAHTISGDHYSQLDPARSADRMGEIVERFRAWRGAD